MKTLKTLVVALAVSALLLGCQTTPTGGKVINPNIATNAAPVLASAVSGAIIYSYSKDATNTLIYTKLIRVVMQEFLLSDDLSAPALQARLYSLPIPALKTPEAQLIITPVLTAYKGFADHYVKAGLKKDPALTLLVQALLDGIDAGLEAISVIQKDTTASLAPPGSNHAQLETLAPIFEAMAKDIRAYSRS